MAWSLLLAPLLAAAGPVCADFYIWHGLEVGPDADGDGVPAWVDLQLHAYEACATPDGSGNVGLGLVRLAPGDPASNVVALDPDDGDPGEPLPL